VAEVGCLEAGMINLQRIASHYGGDVSGGQALIPAIGHSKADRGVAIRPAPDAPDGILVHCFNGSDPMAEKDRLRDDGFLPAFEPRSQLQRVGAQASDPQPGSMQFARSKRTPFNYVDADGVVRYRKVRIERPGRDKTFIFEHPRASGWAVGRNSEPIPYRMAELAAADLCEPLYMAEGEAKADRLASWGLLATSHKDFPAGYAGAYLADRDVIILPDNDQPGADQAGATAAMVKQAGGRPFILPPFPGVGPAGDILDWHGDRAALEALVAETLTNVGYVPLKPVTAPEGFAVIDAADFGDHPAPARRFMTHPFEPWGSATFLTGAGSAGKSLLAQQWLTCTALGLPILGLETAPSRSLYMTCEDDIDELHRRQEAINRALGIKPADLRGKLYLHSLKGEIGNELCTFASDGKMALTNRWRELLATVQRLDIRHLTLDNTAHLFAGNENDRHQVASFVSLLERLAREIDGAVLFISHPNKAGAEFSGSTAWENQVRSRLFLEVDKTNPDGRTLSISKANYSRHGESIDFVWHDGAFHRPDDLPKGIYAEMAATIAASRDNELFLACLAERTKQLRAVSESRSSTYAPTIFATMPESNRIGKKRLEEAMDRLFRIGIIQRGELPWKQDGKTKYGIRLSANAPPTLPADAGDGS
jgi:hypothetical protein